jgi:hypothetical protein
VQALTTVGTLFSAGGVTLTTTSGNLTLNGNVSSTGQTVTLNSAGTIGQSSGVITAATLTGGSVGGTSLGDANAISNLGNFTTSGAFTLDNTVALTQTAGTTVNAGSGAILIDNGGANFAQNGTLTTTNAGAAVTIQNIGTLSVGTITATNGTVALGTASKRIGVTTETGAIAAATLTTQSSGGASFNGQNRIGTLAASTNTGGGGFALNDVTALTVGGAVNAGTADLTLTSLGKLTVNGELTAGNNINLTGAGLLLAASANSGQDVNLATSAGGAIDMTASQTAGRNILSTAQGTTTLTGSFTLNASNVVLSSNGAFTQRGTLTVLSPNLVSSHLFVVDTTGHAGGASQLLRDLGGGTSITNASIIKAGVFAPGGTHNAISFDTGTVNANGSVMLLLGDAGAMTGTVNVLGLGVSGSGGSADLHGSIANNSTQTAAQQGFINPQSQNNYQFNGCAIGSTTCIVLPNLVPIQPQPISQIDILVARPSEEDIDAPLINIFDEEQLCEKLLRVNPEAAREVCR